MSPAHWVAVARMAVPRPSSIVFITQHMQTGSEGAEALTSFSTRSNQVRYGRRGKRGEETGQALLCGRCRVGIVAGPFASKHDLVHTLPEHGKTRAASITTPTLAVTVDMTGCPQNGSHDPQAL
jgi:hypothetical protein